MYQFFPYIIFSSISFVMLVFLAAYGLQYWNNEGVKEFTLTMLSSAMWVFFQAFELMAMTFYIKLFWADMIYLSMISLFAYLLLALHFAGYGHLINKKLIVPIMMIYIIFWILFFTDTFHGLMRTNFSLDTTRIPYTIKKDYGMLYPLYVMFTYGMLLVTLSLLIFTARKRDTIYRKQAVGLFTFIAITMIPNILYYSKISPEKRYDLSPAVLGFAALFLFWAVFRHRLLNIMPIARDLLVERMSSGIIVTDKEFIIIDSNEAIRRLLGWIPKDIIGNRVNDASLLKEVTFTEDNEKPQIIYYELENRKAVFELRNHPILNPDDQMVGWLLIINDITEQNDNLQKLIHQQQAISVMKERERFGRELHDGLGQIFGYINTQAQTVREYLEQNKPIEAGQQLEKLIHVSREAHNDIRKYILDIRGIAPKNRSFTAALKQYAMDFKLLYDRDIEINFQDDIPEGFPKENQAFNLLKIIQEALNNIVKHAGECNIGISFYREGEYLITCITDDGAGFDMERSENGSHYGMDIMKERAHEIGAGLLIHSNLREGTKVIIKISRHALLP